MAARPPYIERHQLARRADLDEAVVKDVFDVILACMEEGVTVRIAGFGNFVPDERPPRETRSPLINGGEPTIRPGGLAMKFRIAPSLRQKWRGVTIPRPLTDFGRAARDVRATRRNPPKE